MYYKEKIISHILCYKIHPNGLWFELSTESLTSIILAERHKNKQLKKTIIKFEDKLKE